METEQSPHPVPRAPLFALVACTVAGMVIGAVWPMMWETTWAISRRLLGGAVMGGWCGLILTARRLLH